MQLKNKKTKKKQKRAKDEHFVVRQLSDATTHEPFLNTMLLRAKRPHVTINATLQTDTAEKSTHYSRRVFSAENYWQVPVKKQHLVQLILRSIKRHEYKITKAKYLLTDSVFWQQVIYITSCGRFSITVNTSSQQNLNT